MSFRKPNTNTAAMNPSIIIKLPNLTTKDDRQYIYAKMARGSLLTWTKEEVQTMIESRNLGKIKEIVLRTDDSKQYAIVHFDHWTRLEIAKHFAVGGNMTVDALYDKRMVMNIYVPKC